MDAGGGFSAMLPQSGSKEPLSPLDNRSDPKRRRPRDTCPLTTTGFFLSPMDPHTEYYLLARDSDKDQAWSSGACLREA